MRTEEEMRIEAAERLEKQGYQPGELRVTLDHQIWVDDGTKVNGYPHTVMVGGFAAAELPHSCDEWFIGGPSHIRALIADLVKALETMGQK
jgi:hypothetical protein